MIIWSDIERKFFFGFEQCISYNAGSSSTNIFQSTRKGSFATPDNSRPVYQNSLAFTALFWRHCVDRSVICPHTVNAGMRAILKKGGLYTKKRGNQSLYFGKEKGAGNMPEVLGWDRRLFGLKIVRNFIKKEVVVFLRHLDESDSYTR
jgi:hypothetical protein